MDISKADVPCFSAQLSSVVEAGETLNRAIEQYEMLLGNGGSGAPPQLTPYQPPSLQQPGSSDAAPSSAGELFKSGLSSSDYQILLFYYKRHFYRCRFSD